MSDGFSLVRGAKGILRCMFDRDVAAPDDPRVLARWDKCEDCDLVERAHGVAYKCGECKCLLKCALRIPEKACPHPGGPRFDAMSTHAENPPAK